MRSIADKLSDKQIKALADYWASMRTSIVISNGGPGIRGPYATEPARLQVLCLLAAGERSVGEMQSLLDLGQSALSQHLAVLREEGLVATRRDAQTIYYSLAPGPAAAVMHTLHGIYCPAPNRSRAR